MSLKCPDCGEQRILSDKDLPWRCACPRPETKFPAVPPMQPRERYALVGTLPEGERCVGIIVHQNQVLVATNKHVYEKVGSTFQPLTFRVEVSDG